MIVGRVIIARKFKISSNPTYYHVTPQPQVENILKHGLIPYAAEEELEELTEETFGKAVFLWDNLGDVKAFCNMMFTPGTILKIDLPSDWKIEKSELMEGAKEFGYSGWEYYSRDAIPPKYIKIYGKC